MTFLPPRVARRIDRLAWRAHAFHRYAHHPLCAAYRPEMLRVGRAWLCKGCTFAVLGGFGGLAAGALLPAFPLRPLVMVAAVALACVGVVFGAAWVRGLGKVGTRLAPSLMAGFLVIQGLRIHSLAGLLLALGAGGALPVAILAYRRRGPWRGPCESCPEREARLCSGFRRQFRRERAFRRVANRFVS